MNKREWGMLQAVCITWITVMCEVKEKGVAVVITFSNMVENYMCECYNSRNKFGEMTVWLIRIK